MKKFFLILLLGFFITGFANDKVLLYSNQEVALVGAESKILYLQKDNIVYSIKLIVENDDVGNVGTVSMELIDSEKKLEDIINIPKAKRFYEVLISALNGPLEMADDTLAELSCFGKCVNKWCNDIPTTAGEILCQSDCAVECFTK